MKVKERWESKAVEGYEVYQSGNCVSVGYLNGNFGSVFGHRSYRTNAAATRAFNRLDTTEKVLAFGRENSLSFP